MNSKAAASFELTAQRAATLEPREPSGRENRKTRYTRQAIREAFIELLREQPIDKVTVTRICELADISRGTFYLHYRDPYDLMESIEDEYLAALELQFWEKVALTKDDYSGDVSFWRELLDELQAARDLAQLFFTNPNSTFLTKCLALNRRYAEEFCKLEYPGWSQREREYSHTFYEHGSASVISLWVRDGFPEPPEHLAALLSSLNSKH
jgi:AcrR family transcriptional regulator